MSRFFNNELSKISPYVPGEQPSGRKFIKLNTNESPFPPSPRAIERAAEAAKNLQLYPALDGGELRYKIAETVGVSAENVAVTNGSDEALNFIFKAFCSKNSPAAFADITYGFYSVFANINAVPYVIIPLTSEFFINPEDYIGINKNIFIANPNAPTGLTISLSDIERIAESNPNNVVVIDEAYVDFGGESAVQLIRKHQNLIVVQTFSKSRSLAGARVGFAVADKEIIDDLYRIIYSTNPYNLSRTNMSAALGALEDPDYTRCNCETVIANREHTTRELQRLGFNVIPSSANFVFASSPQIGGKDLYEKLKQTGILIRHFDKPRISDFVRITIGSREDMDALIGAIKLIINNME